MDFKTMLQFPALNISAVLKILQEIAEKERNEENPKMPKVSINTHSGSAFGFFVTYSIEKNIVLLCDMSDGNAHFEYIESHSISSISITNMDKYGYLLSEGKIPFIPDAGKVPTLLQLKKEISTLQLEFKNTLKKEILIAYTYLENPEDLDKFYASKVLELLKETLSKIAMDKLAKEVFTESISEINFNLNTENKLSIKNKVLSISLDISKGLKSALTAERLKDEIEKNL